MRIIYAYYDILSDLSMYDFSGWDMHDQVYPQELSISNRRNGYRDLLAWIDLTIVRRIPWENDVPFFLLTFKDPDTKDALAVDPRGVVDRTERRALQELGCIPYAGVEYEVSDCPVMFAIQ